MLFLCSFGLDAHGRAGAAQRAVETFADAPDVFEVNRPDTRLWSQARVDAYDPEVAPAIGVIEIPSIGLTAPIVAGTTSDRLDAGAGWMRGSARVGTAGNAVLAAHRDGYFRTLKDLPDRAVIEIATRAGRFVYEVRSIRIVEPDDTSVIQSTERATLTLITCFPFYFVGSAPQRFVVQADLIRPQ